MERAERAIGDRQVRSAQTRSQTTPAMADFRPQAADQRALIQAIQNSPGMVAQRRALDAAFGPVAQRAAPEEELQMKAAPGVAQLAQEDEEKLQMKRAAGVAQLAQEDEEELQMKAGPTAQLEVGKARSDEDGGLPAGLRAGIESLSGVSMDGVKVHYNSGQPAQLNALAYAQGRDIHIAPGEEKHLPHEAWHLVQQAQGRVRPTTQMKGGVPVNTDTALESEADAMGAKAADMASEDRAAAPKA